MSGGNGLNYLHVMAHTLLVLLVETVANSAERSFANEGSPACGTQTDGMVMIITCRHTANTSSIHQSCLCLVLCIGLNSVALGML